MPDYINSVSVRVISLLFTICIVNVINGQSITIGEGGDYPTLEAAESSITAGDTLILLSGVFNDGSQFLEDLHGTVDSPIVLIADSIHGAIFEGGAEAIHLINCSWLEIHGLVIQSQTSNGINIDDGGDYNTPTHHIKIKNCLFRNISESGNKDLLKLSGLDSFMIEQCSFINGLTGGSGIDMVGCHWGIIEDCYFSEAGSSGVDLQPKGDCPVFCVFG